MATQTYFASTRFNLSDGAWAQRSTSVSGFEVTDNDTDGDFDIGDTLTFGGTTGPYLGTMTYLGNQYDVMQSPTQVVILGLSTTSTELPNLSDWVLDNTGAPACFLAGTRIMTASGSTCVEELKAGDRVLRAHGGTTPVLWVGTQRVSTRFGPAERLMPLRVRAGALGDGLPLRDLVLTADHALLVDGLLVNAGALVNGGSIDYVPLAELGDSYTVFHIETEAHDMILAEGAPAETYVDYSARRAFDNYAEYLELYGEDRTIPEMATPRISSARMLPHHLKARLRSAVAA